MALTILYPLNEIQPGEILSDYSEWIYFTLVLIFFISIAGITLRRHFDKPYVKPLIISTGLMMTVGVFMMKEQLTIVFQGWGIIGTMLLVFMAATIPYGLCRGFGMSSRKAFYLSYILFYILSWAKYPDLYYMMADNNMGLLNLGMLIMFLVSLYKILKIKFSAPDFSTEMETKNPMRNEIDREIQIQDHEKKAIKKSERKSLKTEIRTVKNIEEALVEIHQIVETHRNNLPTEERNAIAKTLHNISKSEGIFTKELFNLKQVFSRIKKLDEKQFAIMRDRLSKVSGKEKSILENELRLEEEKIRTEHSILDVEQKLENGLKYFNNFLHTAIKQMQESTYPYDAMPYLLKARVSLKDISALLQKIKALKDRLLSLTKNEKNQLKRERKKA